MDEGLETVNEPNGTARQLCAIAREEIMQALADAYDATVALTEGWTPSVDRWVDQLSGEIADDILRNFEVTAKGGATCGKSA